MVFAVVKNDGVGKCLPKQNATEKHSEERKGTKTQNIADERRITGRFAKRFSGERPVLLGFEFYLFIRVQRVCLAGACICQTPAKVPNLL